MLTTATKNFIPAALSRQVSSPSVYPILSHAIRDVAAPCVRRRPMSSAPAVKKTANFAPFSNAWDVTPFNRFWDDHFFKSPLHTAWDLKPFARQMDMDSDLLHQRLFSPGYEISSNENSVKVTIDLPGIKAADLNVEIKDGQVLHISGDRKVNKDGYTSELRFNKRFTLGQNVDQTKLSASLEDGVLTITAPKIEKVEDVVKIPVHGATENLIKGGDPAC